MQTISQCITRASEDRLIEAARSGDVTDLVEYMYSLLRVQAAALVRRFRAFNRSLEVDDLRQEGVEHVIRNLDKALLRENPVSWLLVVAQRQMLHYCEEYRSPVRVPRSSQRRGAKVPLVLSLDAPLSGYEDLTLLDLFPASVGGIR